ncbi:MAG: rRNA (guanine-N2)-methyltransferase [Treponema sp.]|nr:MAG: rRNA (guanine-N2)-methyltransferase [Treponema sp.]
MTQFLGLCAIGAESVFNKELKLNGFRQTEKLSGRVFFSPVNKDEDFLESAFKANYFLRIPDKIGLVLSSFKCFDFDILFEGIYSIPWENYFHKNTKIILDKVISFKSKLASEHAVQSIAHKAIYKKLTAKWKMLTLPETGETQTVRIYIDQNKVFVVLDLSGEPLHKRGYRLKGGIAPMRETMASSLLQFMQWKRKTPLHDPFCGSGTIPIEATWYAHNVPAGINRNFAFEKLACFSKEHLCAFLKSEKQKAIEKIKTDCIVRITGSDIDLNAIDLSCKNAEKACQIAEKALESIGRFEKLTRPEFIQADISEIEAPYETGCLIGNPPYGERIGEEKDAMEIYKKISLLPRYFENWKLGFITNKPELEEIVSKQNRELKIKPSVIKSGKLDTIFYMF